MNKLQYGQVKHPNRKQLQRLNVRQNSIDTDPNKSHVIMILVAHVRKNGNYYAKMILPSFCYITANHNIWL